MSSPYLSLDFGLKRTGVALSVSGILVEPLTTISWNPPHSAQLMQEILRLAARHEVRTIVVGIPVNEDDSPTPQSLKTLALVHQLEQACAKVMPDVSVVYVNEYFSTQDAQQLLPGVDKDAAAAAVILQDYLESKTFS